MAPTAPLFSIISLYHIKSLLQRMNVQKGADTLGAICKITPIVAEFDCIQGLTGTKMKGI